MGKTQSGTWGLFTGGFLAWPLYLIDVMYFQNHEDELAKYCKARGFEWTGKWTVKP